MSKPRIALLGTGIMGSGMARRLLAAGFPLTVYNRRREKAAPLAAAGAQVAGSPREAASQADVVHAMVADNSASRSVWLGENGALAGIARGAVCIESSTLTVEWIRELAAEAVAAGGSLLDAPVTGSKEQAASGELNFLVGGDGTALDKARSALEAMSKNIYHLGPSGSGAIMKLINNFNSATQAAALAQGLALIERSGLNAEQALSVITNGAPGSPLVKTLAPRMAARNFAPNFFVRLMAKDMRYAIGEGKRLGLNLTLAEATLKLFENAIEAGLSEQDFSSIIEPLRAE